MDDLNTAEPVDYVPEIDLVRRPLLTFGEAQDVLAVLRKVAESGGADGVEARRLAHVLAYRLPAG